jgi:NAD(P)-dependent dehydrogenase (short-subunit alcohol dehydrogenase family)
MSGLRLDGRVAAVTGAGRGIGRSYALLLGELGASVVVNDLGAATTGEGGDAGPAEKVAEEIRAAGGTAIANTANIASVEGGASVVEDAVREFGRIDIVVNNAGNMVWGGFPEATIETIDAHLDVHVRGSFHTIKAAFPHFLAQDFGRIVNTTSVGMFGLPDNLGYAIAKASFIGMAKSMTLQRGDANIMINNRPASPRETARTSRTSSRARPWTPGSSRRWSPTCPTRTAPPAARPTSRVRAGSGGSSSAPPSATSTRTSRRSTSTTSPRTGRRSTTRAATTSR